MIDRNYCIRSLATIATDLCDRAIWSSDSQRCNWVARSMRELTSDGSINPVASTLGHDVYSGLGGIIIFLSQCYGNLGTHRYAEAALGAMRMATQKWEELSATTHICSFFTGGIGLAYASGLVAKVSDSEEAYRSAASLGRKAAANCDGNVPLDVIAGAAGAIPAFLFLADLLNDKQYIAAAVSLGWRIVNASVDTPSGCYWLPDAPDVDHRTQSESAHTLTGMSHGLSGIALSLLRLWKSTHEDTFLRLARRAFSYENSLFSTRERSWPDFRQSKSTRAQATQSFATAWCHGSPGILVARVQASRLDTSHSHVYLENCQAAAEPLVQYLLTTPSLSSHDATLCHGYSGIASCLATYFSSIDDSNLHEQINSSVEHIARCIQNAELLRSGLPSGQYNPSLMLGTSGVGYFLLRWLFNAAPDVLAMDFLL